MIPPEPLSTNTSASLNDRASTLTEPTSSRSRRNVALVEPSAVAVASESAVTVNPPMFVPSIVASATFADRAHTLTAPCASTSASTGIDAETSALE